jgi:hypothetical protein
MERETGIEPATNGLGSRDSTTELLPLRGIQSLAPGKKRSNFLHEKPHCFRKLLKFTQQIPRPRAVPC